jgi:AcrR family transcriptional regulator
LAGYETIGRTGQKRRTRDALKAAAAELIRAGAQPTVVEVAEAAGISKSTAYRYFPSQELMYAEILVTATVDADRQQVYAAAEGEGEVAERVDRVMRADHAFTLRHLAALRTGMRAFLLLIDSYPDAPLEPSNRVRYLTTALEPLRDQLSDEMMSRLVAALALCVGVEAETTTRVRCGLSVDDSEEVKRWAAAALLRAAIEEGCTTGDRLPSGSATSS